MHLSHLALTTVTLFFSGLPARSISHLQYIQNSATRMLTYTKQSALCSYYSYSFQPPLATRLLSYHLQKFFCLPLSHFTVLHLLISLDILSPYTPSRLLRSSGGELILFLDLAFHLWEGRSFSVMAPNLGTHCPWWSSGQYHTT